jgi:plasmid maintenance system antidote protein VapI
MENQQEIHIGSIIKAELDRQGRKPQWFATQLNFERTNIYNIFRRKSIDTALLLRISQILQFDFFSFYSKQVSYVGNYSTNS